MKALKFILLAVLALIVIASLYLATLDGEYEVKRSRIIDASPEVVFQDLNDYRNWEDWGPWFEQDSSIALTYPEQTSGKGAYYTWTGKDGGGKMTTLAEEPSKRIDQELVFNTPFGDMSSDVSWLMEEVGDSTKLTWWMRGELPFLSRWMAAGMDSQLGPMQDRGLELFDQNITKKMDVFSTSFTGEVDYGGGFYLYLTTSSKISNMGDNFAELMEELQDYIKTHKVRVAGAPFTIYHEFDVENGTTLFSVAFPVSEKLITAKDSDVLTGFMENGKYAKLVLKGSYKNSEAAWNQADSEAKDMATHTLDPDRDPFEVYVNLPESTPNPADLITEIYIPIKRR